jgi:hypothetical protein
MLANTAQHRPSPAGYIDVVAIELFPQVRQQPDCDNARSRAALRLYASIAENRPHSFGLHVSV